MSAAAVSVSPIEHIVVDLDGTLVRTDTFIACALEAVRRRPLCLFTLLAMLLRGRALCKKAAAALGRIRVDALPYNNQLIEYLRDQRMSGMHLILATGADQSIARGVADHLGIFEEVICSDGDRNMTGREKLRAIRERLGDLPFAYVGNSRADLQVWRGSQAAILVAAPEASANRLRREGIAVRREFEPSRIRWHALVRCLRWHQWSKNVLVFVPIVLAHRIFDFAVISHAAAAFLAFSCCASALYVANDLLDLQADRLHPTKRRRPLAAGEVSILTGMVLAVVMILAAAGIAAVLPLAARLLLLVYAASSLAYSLKLKRLLFLDVVSLALLYALRLLYGGSATGIKISVWTLAFSLFLFASLATVKRLAELRRVAASASQDYRGYREIDINQLSSLAAAAGFVAVLVLALYINSPEVTLLYRRAQGLWLLCPVLIYWIGRLTLIANRGHLDDDPVLFALKDRSTWITGAVAAAILAVST
jgi:4-hydroxybenzoate polyprenyltransferase/phosphoglycolate phosphatase-like HAD superfamily hydrolase